VIDEWQMHLNKSIAGIAHCKYPALVLLSYLASLQPPSFLRAVRAASLSFHSSVTYGPTLFISLRSPAPPMRRRLSRLLLWGKSPAHVGTAGAVSAPRAGI